MSWRRLPFKWRTLKTPLISLFFLLVLYQFAFAELNLIGEFENGRPRDVFVRGNYAYLSNWNEGVKIVDISDLYQPQETGEFPSSGAAGIDVVTDCLYLASGNSGLKILDVSKPDKPSELSTLPLSGFAEDVSVSGGYAFVACGNEGVKIVDVSNSTAPCEVGNLDTIGYAWRLSAEGNYCYLADGSGGLVVLDVSNKGLPVEAGSYPIDLARDVCISGSYAFVASWSEGLKIFNISDPREPQETGKSTGIGDATGVCVAGNFAYVASYTSGLRVVDISNVYSPEEVDFSTTSGYAFKTFVRGENIFLADDENFLIFRFSNASEIYSIGGCVKNFYGIGAGEVMMNLTGAGISFATDSNGYYEFINLSTGHYKITPSKNNFIFEPYAINIFLDADKTQQNFMATELKVTGGEVEVRGEQNGYINPMRGEKLTVYLRPVAAGRVSVKIFNLLGELLLEKSEEVLSGVDSYIKWAGVNKGGEIVASGIYLLYVKGAGFNVKKKIAVVK